MTLAEAYAAIDAVVKPNQSIFIGTTCRWYDRPDGPRELAVDFAVSLVPGFNGSCDSFSSTVSLQSAVDQCVAASEEAANAPATVDDATPLITEAGTLVPLPTVPEEHPESDIPF